MHVWRIPPDPRSVDPSYKLFVGQMIVILTCCLAARAATMSFGGKDSGTSATSKVSKAPSKKSEPYYQESTPTPRNLMTRTLSPFSSRKSSQLPEHSSSTMDILSDEEVPASSVTQLHVVGLFGIDGIYPVGKAFQYASEIAVEDINKRANVLPGYRLVLEPVNTECNTATGMDLLYRKLYAANSTKIMVLGGTCSHVTEQTALASYKYNMVQISYSAVSPRLSGEEFRWFFRVMAPETQLSDVRIKLLKEFNWTTITIVQAAEHLFSSTTEVMKERLKHNNITLNDTIPFEKYPQGAIEQLKKNDARIIYFSSYEDQARMACCTAYRLNFTGPKIVWIFPGFFDLKWYDHPTSNCTAEEILKVIDGYLTVSNVNMAEEDSEDNIGTSQKDYLERFKAKAARDSQKEYKELLKSGREIQVPGEGRAPLAYDAVWAIALSLNSTLTDYIAEGRDQDVLKSFSYTNHKMGERIFNNMHSTKFRGLSGNVSFTPTGDRIPQIVIKQFRVVDWSTQKVEMKVIGRYTDSKMTEWSPEAVHWRGGRVPHSSRLTVHVLKPLSLDLYVAMSLLSALGVMLCIAFLVFNIKNRNVRLIKMSSPNINNLILVGCILVYTSVIVQDVKGVWLDCLCHVRLYLTVLGFSLGYGAMFAKTWRVYEIMTASRRFTKVTKDLRDSRLLMTVLVLVAINLLVLVIWTAFDPMAMTPKNIEDSEIDREDDVLEIKQTLVCQSRYQLQFTLGLIALQALLILFGAFLAFQTRKMTIPELNDSRWVGLCIYNVVVLGSLGTILVLGTSQTPHVDYLLMSIITTLGTTLTQCLVFVPKLLAYRRMKHGRKYSEQSILNVKTICVGATYPSSSSLQTVDDMSTNTEASTARGLPLSPSSSSPAKALRKASRSLSTALKRCCSVEMGRAKEMKQQGIVDDAKAGQCYDNLSIGKISRAVSACNFMEPVGGLEGKGESLCESSSMQERIFNSPARLCNLVEKRYTFEGSDRFQTNDSNAVSCQCTHHLKSKVSGCNDFPACCLSCHPHSKANGQSLQAHRGVKPQILNAAAPVNDEAFARDDMVPFGKYCLQTQTPDCRFKWKVISPEGHSCCCANKRSEDRWRQPIRRSLSDDLLEQYSTSCMNRGHHGNTFYHAGVFCEHGGHYRGVLPSEESAKEIPNQQGISRFLTKGNTGGHSNSRAHDVFNAGNSYDQPSVSANPLNEAAFPAKCEDKVPGNVFERGLCCPKPVEQQETTSWCHKTPAYLNQVVCNCSQPLELVTHSHCSAHHQCTCSTFQATKHHSGACRVPGQAHISPATSSVGMHRSVSAVQLQGEDQNTFYPPHWP